MKDTPLSVNTTFTRKDFEDFLESHRVSAPISYIIDYWEKKNWLTNANRRIMTLAAAVNTANGIYCENLRKRKSLKETFRQIDASDDKKDWSSKRTNYQEQLSSDEWQAFREFIFVVRGRRCEVCGKRTNLHIHHKKYINNRFAWEYLPNDVMVLCNSCHEKAHKITKNK